MTGSERFDIATGKIESEIKKVNKSHTQIAIEAASSVGFSDRDLSTVFRFLCGKTLIDYIRERRMMAATKNILDSETFNAQNAVEISGLGDQPTFNKRFKVVHGITPKELFEKKDTSFYKVKLTWDKLGNTEVVPVSAEETALPSVAVPKIFDIEYSKYTELKGIIELQELYGFDELQSEIAYYIYKTHNVPLKDSFRFVDEYEYREYTKEDEEKDKRELKDFFGLPEDYQFAPEEDIPHLSREEFYEERVKQDANNPEIRYVYFNCEMNNIYTVYNVIDLFHRAGIQNIVGFDTDVIEICAYNEIDIAYCWKAIKYYKEHATKYYGKDAFAEYVNYMLEGRYIEEAFSNIMELDDYDELDNTAYVNLVCKEMNEYDADDPFEKWAADETDYSDKYR